MSGPDGGPLLWRSLCVAHGLRLRALLRALCGRLLLPLMWRYWLLAWSSLRSGWLILHLWARLYRRLHQRPVRLVLRTGVRLKTPALVPNCDSPFLYVSTNKTLRSIYCFLFEACVCLSFELCVHFIGTASEVAH